MMVLATDAPLDGRALERLAMRAMLGLSRTGAIAENGSGDYVIAFSTHPDVRRQRESAKPIVTPELLHASMDPLFTAAVEATEESVYNALLKATTVKSARGQLTALPIEPLKAILEKYGALKWDKKLP